MPRKSIIVIAVLLGILFAVGYAEAGERGTSTRSPSVRSVAAGATQVQSAGALSLSKILHTRFLRTWKMLADLQDVQPDPPVFTNGLSDGPDPIDGSGSADGGDGQSGDEKNDDSDGGVGSGDDDNDGTSLQPK